MGRPGFEETVGPVVPGRKEYTRADSDNWRILREEQEEEEGVEPGTNWRLAGARRDGTINTHVFIDLLQCCLKFLFVFKMKAVHKKKQRHHHLFLF